MFGAHASDTLKQRHPAGNSVHTYLRITPELRAKVWGPKAGDEPRPSGERHPVLKGFDETDILPFGGELGPLRLESGVNVPLTFIPAFPGFPPEVSWMRQPNTDIPGLVLREKGMAKIAYFPADIDSRYGKDHLPDHANLLANTVQWAAGANRALDIQGPGFLDCHLYSQRDCLVLHIINLSNEAAWKAPVEELIPVGPLQVSVKLANGMTGHSAQSLVSQGKLSAAASNGWTRFQIPSVRDQEVIVIR